MAVAGIGTVITNLFGGWSSVLGILITFISIDFISGWAAARVDGKLSSKVGFKGIAKKVMILGFVAIAHLIDVVLGTEVAMVATLYFYLANELLSITENAGVMGVPFPPAVKNAIEVLSGKVNRISHNGKTD